MDITSIQRDSESIDSGVWVDNIPGMGDLRLKVRGYNSLEAISLRSQKMRSIPMDDRLDGGTLKTEDGLRINGEVHAEAILLDWENLKQGAEEVPFSVEVATELCTNRDFLLFNDAVAFAAVSVDNKASEEATVLGKS